MEDIAALLRCVVKDDAVDISVCMDAAEPRAGIQIASPSALCLSYFDDSVQSALPQSMPPPFAIIPNHSDAVLCLDAVYESLRRASRSRQFTSFTLCQARSEESRRISG